jgi:selenocysteine lyase/cysteine desulfurase
MSFSRRTFLAAGGALALAATAPGRVLAALEKSSSASLKPVPGMSWDEVRRQFALDPGLLHFSSFYVVSHPRPVRAAIEAYRRELDANPFEVVEHRMFVPDEAANIQYRVRDAVAAYTGGTRDHVAITTSTTMGLGLVYHGLPLRAGDDLLLTTHDHFVHHESARLAAERAGANVRRIPLYDRAADVGVATVTERIRRAIQPATRVIGVTWVHSSTGVRLPIPDIAAVVREANRNRAGNDRIVLVVDGVHGLGCAPERVADLGADFFCAGTHKWMFAPRGTGIVWGSPESWARLRPIFASFASFAGYQAWMDDAQPPPTDSYLMSPGGFAAFEHQWAMAEAFRFHQALGRERTAARIRELNDQLKAGLAAIPGLTLHTPMDPALSAGMACFELAGHSPEQIVARLRDRRIIASTSPYRVTYARLAPSLVNDPTQVETAIRELRALART